MSVYLPRPAIRSVLCLRCKTQYPFKGRDYCEDCRPLQQKERKLNRRRNLIETKRCPICGGLANRGLLRLCGSCFIRKSATLKKTAVEQKLQVFQHYGGAICSCCAVIGLEFLSLDHVNNNGNKDPDSGGKLYRRLIKENFPPGFRVLCHNCNLGRHINGGVCPHKDVRNQIIVSNLENSVRDGWMPELPHAEVVSPEQICFA